MFYHGMALSVKNIIMTEKSTPVIINKNISELSNPGA